MRNMELLGARLKRASMLKENFRRLLAALALVSSGHVANAQTVLPNDAKATCPVTTAVFASWFSSGTVAANGIVDHPDNLTFPGYPLCNFYQQSEHMFLWLTSPAPPKYNGGSYVFNSPVFYDVSPLDANGQRSLIPTPPDGIRSLGVKISQLGPQNRPVVFDNAGKMHTFAQPEVGPSGKPLIRNKAGASVEIERTEIEPYGKPIFLDKAGNAIDFQLTRRGTPRLLDRTGKVIDFRLNKIVLNGKRFFLDGAGNVIETEQGQADQKVLMTQGDKLVYYAIQVNDVYAYFLTGTKNGGIIPALTTFPTTQADLTKVENFGLSHSKPSFPDANALAVAIKSAWIETTGLADVSRYVTVTATIPTYDMTNSTHWVPNGSKQAQLALVGMHVVYSAWKHPEMLWATFEHVNNTPNAGYTYVTKDTVTMTVQPDIDKTWLFSASGAVGPFNTPRMFLNGANIDALDGKTIGPSNVLRLNPWGTAAASGGTFTQSNTDIISINKSIIDQLLPGDVRKNYIMIGTTWTEFGDPPPSDYQSGTQKMANTTMETFLQGDKGSNCFDCHVGSNTMLGLPKGGGLSHIWGPLKALFP
jgi:hypothetical protein